MTLRGYVSCVTDCPYEGPIAPAAVAEVAARLLELGCREVSLGDTIGRGDARRRSPRCSRRCWRSRRPPGSPGISTTPAGRALDNIEICLGFGLATFDAAVGGLGGCPYAPGAPGNVATEAVAARLAALGHATGVDPDAPGGGGGVRPPAEGGGVSYATIVLEIDDDGVARLTLNRPERHNALSAAMCDELTDAAAALDADAGRCGRWC